MDGLYAESRAKKKVTMKDNLIKFLIVGVILACFVIGIIGIKVILFILGLILLVAAYYLMPALSTEYEYVFCDGQVDFDRINGGSYRKTVLRVDFERLVVIAPKNSHALDGYRHNGVVVKDFSSMEEDAKIYGMVVTSEEKLTLIYFEPNEKMLAAMKQKAPRKIMDC